MNLISDVELTIKGATGNHRRLPKSKADIYTKMMHTSISVLILM